MLAVARALMARPRLLMLDEPTTGLAPMIAQIAFEALEGLKSDGMTLLIAEQQVPLALSVADRGYVLENGRIRLERDIGGARPEPGGPTRVPGCRMSRRLDGRERGAERAGRAGAGAGMTAVILDGLVLGLAFGLLGVGMTLVYGLGGVLNLAYGQMVVLAAIVVMLVMETALRPFWRPSSACSRWPASPFCSI